MHYVSEEQGITLCWYMVEQLNTTRIVSRVQENVKAAEPLCSVGSIWEGKIFQLSKKSFFPPPIPRNFFTLVLSTQKLVSEEIREGTCKRRQCQVPRVITPDIDTWLIDIDDSLTMYLGWVGQEAEYLK